MVELHFNLLFRLLKPKSRDHQKTWTHATVDDVDRCGSTKEVRGSRRDGQEERRWLGEG